MNAITYLLQVNIYLIIFFGFYWLLLKKETFNTYNRVYLVISAIASFAIPFWNSDWVQGWFITQKTTEVFATIKLQDYNLNKIDTSENYTITDYISILYNTISLLFAIKLVVNIFNLYQYFNQNESIIKAFSFFNNIFIANDIDPDDVIYNHERVHATQYHSFDILLFEIIGIFCWFNPITYAYKIAIKNIHEFIADEIASQKMGSKVGYAMLLFSEKFQTHPSVLVSNFFSKTSLKIRIEMLNKTKSNRTAILKYGLIAPIFMGMLVFTSVTIAKGKEFSLFFSKKTISGQILNHKNQPISGASIIVLGTNIGTNSDIKGNFTIPVKNSNNKLIFSHVGYQSKYLKVNSEKQFTVSLKVQNKQLNGIVVLDIKKNEAETAHYQVINISKKINSPNIVEQNAEYIGGTAALYSFLNAKLIYPKEAQKNKKEGVVYTNFTIEKDGSISNIRLANPLGYIGFLGFGLEEEAKRVLRLMPKWQPAIQNGQPEATSYSLPIQFVLNNKQKINQDEPKLFYVNGVLTTEKIAMAIDHDKIQSVSVLKNEAAIKKYGEKGKNGVIEIILKDENTNQTKPEGEEIFTVVEQQAEFKGGFAGLANYLQKNLYYPQRAQNARVEAKVFASFVVRKSGEITDIKIIKGAGFGLDEEAIRVIKAMPKWIPAMQSGLAVNSQFNLPISFNLK